MNKGMEMMIKSLIKMLGLDPELIMSAIEQIRGSVLNASGDIAIIRRDQLRIMEKLGIPLTEELDNERSLISAGTGEAVGKPN